MPLTLKTGSLFHADLHASSRRARVDEALKTLPEGTEGHTLDLADEAAVRAVFARLGNFDHLVFTAGESLQLDRLANTDIEGARRFFGVRYWGAYLATKSGSGNIREGGSIVFTSGIAGQRPRPGWSLAGSICAAMEGLTLILITASVSVIGGTVLISPAAPS
jgi:NAD(P)-dependent dehydrogenase (short-subunit alcohol dehydrogenase family)